MAKGGGKMGLIDYEQRPCEKFVKSDVPDNEGGRYASYIHGCKFNAIISPNSGSSKVLADNEISAKQIKVFYPTAIDLQLHDVIRTLDDGKIYRITTGGSQPPKSASVQYSLAVAEEWEVPNE